MSDIDKQAIDVSLMPTAIPWIVVFYHSFFAIWAHCGFIGSLIVLVLKPLDATTLLGPPLALLCTLLLGWTAWGIAHRQATAVRWSRRVHLLIARLGLLGAPLTLWMIWCCCLEKITTAGTGGSSPRLRVPFQPRLPV